MDPVGLAGKNHLCPTSFLSVWLRETDSHSPAPPFTLGCRIYYLLNSRKGRHKGHQPTCSQGQILLTCLFSLTGLQLSTTKSMSSLNSGWKAGAATGWIALAGALPPLTFPGKGLGSSSVCKFSGGASGLCNSYSSLSQSEVAPSKQKPVRA